MSHLKSINLSNNKLTCLPYTMFSNLSNLNELNVSSNNFISFELWLMQIKNFIDYSNNPVTHFTNNYNVDLSNYQSNITAKILIANPKIKIDFDDSIFPMYNRCEEIYSNEKKNLMETIKIIHLTNPGLLRLNCSCKQYYLQKYIISMLSIFDFATWSCAGPNQYFHVQCSNQSSFDYMNVEPRFCKVNQSEEGIIPKYKKIDSCNLVS